MKNFDDYEVIDFVLNDSFVQWASGNADAGDDYWPLWISLHPHKVEAFNMARQIVLHLRVNPIRNLTHGEVDTIVNQILTKNALSQQDLHLMPVINIRWYQRSWLKMAAMLLIILSIALIGYYGYQRSAKSDYNNAVALTNDFILRSNETSAPIWVRLPDKTSVILKPGSQLKYRKVFTAVNREVYLTGEAFFEVTKNPKRPFFVYANEMTTRVLGTSFTVKAFKGDKKFKVVVNTGKVAVFATATDDAQATKNTSVLVVPNQQATFYRKEMVLIKDDLKKPLMLSKEVSKVVFDFNETPFSKVVSAIKDAYGINITYNEKNLANCPLTASLTDLPLYEKLDLICKAVEAHYDLTEGEIYIDGKGCHNN